MWRWWRVSMVSQREYPLRSMLTFLTWTVCIFVLSWGECCSIIRKTVLLYDNLHFHAYTTIRYLQYSQMWKTFKGLTDSDISKFTLLTVRIFLVENGTVNGELPDTNLLVQNSLPKCNHIYYLINLIFLIQGKLQINSLGVFSGTMYNKCGIAIPILRVFWIYLIYLHYRLFYFIICLHISRALETFFTSRNLIWIIHACVCMGKRIRTIKYVRLSKFPFYCEKLK